MEAFATHFTRWLEGIADELTFWNDYLLNRGGEYFPRFSVCEDRRRPFALEQDIPEADYGKEYKVLDVGSGPFSRCGLVSDKVRLDMLAVDPLAYGYQYLKEKYRVDNGGRLETAFVELLDRKFPADTFDMVHMSNALDHSFDPIFGIWQMLRVVRRGGCVILRHHENEAENENYEGFHQWNLMVRDGAFVVWRRGEETNVSQLVAQVADVAVYPHLQEEGGGWIYDKVVLTKKAAVSLPENAYYDTILEKVYEELLKVTLRHRLVDHDLRQDPEGRLIMAMADMYRDEAKFQGCAAKMRAHSSVAIYGMGACGRDLYWLLTQYGIPVTTFIDRSAIQYVGKTAVPVDQYQRQAGEAVIVASKTHETEMWETLRAAGLTEDVYTLEAFLGM